MIVLLLFSLRPTTGCKRWSEVHMIGNSDSIFPTFALKGAQELNETGHLTAWSNICLITESKFDGEYDDDLLLCRLTK